MVSWTLQRSTCLKVHKLALILWRRQVRPIHQMALMDLLLYSKWIFSFWRFHSLFPNGFLGAVKLSIRAESSLDCADLDRPDLGPLSLPHGAAKPFWRRFMNGSTYCEWLCFSGCLCVDLRASKRQCRFWWTMATGNADGIGRGLSELAGFSNEIFG